MVVGNQSRALARCLESALRHVSSFVMFDAGSTDNTRTVASSMLSARRGRILELDPDFSSDPVPSLYAKASERAEYVLFMHPDEVIRMIYQSAPDSACDAQIVEIDFGRCSFMQPRLVRSGLPGLPAHPFRAVGRDAGEFTVATAGHLLVSKQSLRAGGGQAAGKSCWHLHLGRRESAARTAEDCVELAIHCSQRGDLAGARGWLSSGLAVCDTPESEWQLRYLLGLASVDGGDKTGASQEFARAFELDPLRLEPLHQLVRIKISEGDLQSAVALSRLALDIDIPLSTGYLERRVYERERYIQHIVILERLGEHVEAKEACDALLDGPDLGIDLRRFLEKSSKRYDSLLKLAPKATGSRPPPGGSPLVTVGMAVADDYDGVYFTVMSILLYHGECLDRLEFLVVDNNPVGASADATRRLCEKLGMRYLPVSDYRSTAVRDSVFRYASGRFVLCLDSHVMLRPGALAGLIEYIEASPGSPDLLQGPLANDRGDRLFTHLEGEWKDGMYGVWAQTEGISTDSPPFEIPMQGLGVFCCRRDAWPGLNPRFSGFGGEEGYLHEKFRRAGGKVVCLPFLQWVHRFERPLGIPYRMNWPDRIRNYLIGHDELGWEHSEMATHFARVAGFEEMSSALSGFLRERESPFYEFDAVYFLDHETDSEISAEMSERFEELGISSRVRRIALGTCQSNRQFLGALHRLLDSSRTHGFRKVLLLSSLELLPYDLEEVLETVIDGLASKAWSICFLGLEQEPGIDSPLNAAEPGIVRVQHDAGNPTGVAMQSYSSCLVNLEAETDWMDAWPAFVETPEQEAAPTAAETTRETPDAPTCYTVSPPATVRRNRFDTVGDPARYCSTWKHALRS